MFQSKYEHHETNSLFASVLHQISNIPEGYEPHHLRYQVLKSVVVTRDSLKAIIKDDLVKGQLNYKQFAEQLATPEGPFCFKATVRSLRLLLGIPMAIYRCDQSQKKGGGGRRSSWLKCGIQ